VPKKRPQLFLFAKIPVQVSLFPFKFFVFDHDKLQNEITKNYKDKQIPTFRPYLCPSNTGTTPFFILGLIANVEGFSVSHEIKGKVWN
jgi:hypothetical protein